MSQRMSPEVVSLIEQYYRDSRGSVKVQEIFARLDADLHDKLGKKYYREPHIRLTSNFKHSFFRSFSLGHKFWQFLEFPSSIIS